MQEDEKMHENKKTTLIGGLNNVKYHQLSLIVNF
jgi:hypothetical protein